MVNFYLSVRQLRYCVIPPGASGAIGISSRRVTYASSKISSHQFLKNYIMKLNFYISIKFLGNRNIFFKIYAVVTVQLIFVSF